MTGCRLPRQNELSTGLNIPMKWRRCVQSKKLMLLFLVLISRLATTSADDDCEPQKVACTCTKYPKINATGGFHRGLEFKYCGGDRTSTFAYNGSFCCQWTIPGQSCNYCAKLECPYGSITKSTNYNNRGYCTSKANAAFFDLIFYVGFPAFFICFGFCLFRCLAPRAFRRWCKCCPKPCQPTWPNEPNIPVSSSQHPPVASSKEADIPFATSNPIHGPIDMEMAKQRKKQSIRNGRRRRTRRRSLRSTSAIY